MRRPVVVSLLALAGLTAWFSPAVPALIRYGTLPHHATQPMNIVLAGMDVDYDYKAATWPYPPKPLDFTTRTDTLLLAQVHPAGQVNLLSIPRDTWVNMDGYGWGKINGANVHGGPDLLMNTVTQLTGLAPEGYLFLSLSAVRDLTNAVGGVTVDVPQRMKYDDNAGHLHIDLQPGRQKLNGEQAEGFLRFRHDSMSDIGRVGRQQMYMTALLNKLKNPLNWWRLPAVAGALNRNTKSNLSRSQVGALLGAVLSGPKINPQTVPGDFGRGGTWVVDSAGLRQIIHTQFRDPGDPHSLNISLVNLDAPPGSAKRLQDRLTGLGYDSVTIAEETRHTATTTIAGNSAASSALQRELGYGTVSQETPTPGADVTVRLGNDAK